MMDDLQREEIAYNLGFAGVDQKTDDKSAPLGKPRELANVRFPKTGAVAKRNGLMPATVDAVDSGGTIERIMTTPNGGVLAVSNLAGARSWKNLISAPNGIPSYPGNPTPPTFATLSTGVPGVSGRPPVPRATVDRVPIAALASDLLVSVDAAVGISQTCYVYRQGKAGVSTILWFKIVDNATGETVKADASADSTPYTSSPKHYVHAVPGTNVFVFCSTISTTLTVKLVSSAGVLATDTSVTLNANGAFDVAMVGSTLLVAYRTSAATTLTVTKWTVTATALGSPSSSSALVMTVGPVNVAIAVPYSASDSAILILVNDATNGLRGLTVTISSLAISQALWTIDATLYTLTHLTGAVTSLSGSAPATSITIAEVYNATDYLNYCRQWTTTTGSGGTSAVLALSMYLCSKPVVNATYSANPVVMLGHYSKAGSSAGLQHARFLFEAGTGKCVLARLMRFDVEVPQSAMSVNFGGGAEAIKHLPSISAMPANSAIFGSPVTDYLCPAINVVQTAADEAGAIRFRNIAAMRFTFDPGRGYDYVQDGASLLIQGGYLAIFDGQMACENGFLLYPEIVSVTASAGAGALPNNGSFQFVAVFVWLDGNGQLHRSAPSEAVAGTTGAADNTFAVVVRGLTPSMKQYYGVELYRTEDNGTEFYLCEGQYNVVPNSSGERTFNITGTDATLVASTPLGQQNGILDNEQPNCPVGIATLGRRLMVVPGDDRFSVYESKERRAGEGAVFFDSVKRRITQEGEIFGLTTLGERWAAMKRRRWFIASGDGADDTGQGDTLSEFEAHPTVGIGCANPRHAVRTPLGIVFKSEKGFYLLDTGGSIAPLPGVDDYRDFVVKSAVFHSDAMEVHFLLVDGPRLVLSLHETEQGITPMWTVDEFDDPNQLEHSDITVASGLLYAATEERATPSTSPASLLVESIGDYTDRSTSNRVTMRVTTGWIRLGWVRLYWARLLGTVQGVHTARVRAAYDFVDEWVDDKQITSEDATAGGTAPYMWEFRPTRPRIRAIKLEFTEVLTEASRGPELNQILFSVGHLPGSKRLQGRQRSA